jgi:signal transduction histidine kinase
MCRELRKEGEPVENSIFDLTMTMKELELFMDQSTARGVILINTDKQIVSCNKMILNKTGYALPELHYKPVRQLIPIDSLALHTRHFTHDTNRASPPPLIPIRTRDGRKLPCHYSILSVKSADRDYYLIFLSEFRQEVHELSLLQRFADAFMKDVNLGVLLIDLDFTLVDISDMACFILGIAKNSAVNRPMDEIFSAVPLEHRIVQRTLLDGMIVRNHAISWMNDETRYELLMDTNVLRDDEGRITGAYVIFKDVTNLRSLEQQVQRSDRLAMIGQIAAGTAHEIRNPLTSIKGFMQMLGHTFREKGMEKEQGFTQIMLAEIDRINVLVSEFLLLSKPKDVTFDQVDIPVMLNEILPIINNEAILHGVTVHYESQEGLPRIVADKELLKQVYLNLCKNGIEAMVDGGELTITEKVDEESRAILINFHDTGPGIPVFLIDKIFDPFFTTKASGTGLGLSVCQRIIHDIGGTIRVSCKGYGTTFTVSIPHI